MSKSRQAAPITASIRESVSNRILAKVSSQAALFEARWTMNTLLRESPDLHEALEDQQGMFHESLVTGDDRQIVMHGEATCRGWQAAIIAMEKSGIADDAYHVGVFGHTTVVIGRSKTPPQHLIEQYGEDLVYLNPREVAAIWVKIEQVAEVKRLWPDAEVMDIRSKAEVAE